VSGPRCDDDDVEAGQKSASLAGIDRTRSAVFAVFGCLAAMMAGYVAWLVGRPHFSYSLLWNGWMPDGFELLVSGLCIARGLVRQAGRAVALALGFGLLSWSLGDTT